MLAILGLEYEARPVDFYPGREHTSDALMRLNPLGQLPILEDCDLILRDAQAILTYLAIRYDENGSWYPVSEPQRLGQVAQWLAFSQEITNTAGAARLHDTLFYKLDVETARSRAHTLFRILDEHLWFAETAKQNWICPGDTPTIADIACFPYVILSEEGGVSRQDYPAIRRWCDRVKRLLGFLGMPGVFPTSSA